MEWIIYLLIIWFVFPTIFFGLLGFNLKRTKNKRLYVKPGLFSSRYEKRYASALLKLSALT